MDAARTSVTCSTFNFQRSSGLWTALRDAAARPEISLRIYLDAHAADFEPPPWSPRTAEVVAHLRPRVAAHEEVRRRLRAQPRQVPRHRPPLLAGNQPNFSYSAEHGNLEFGVLIDNPNLTESVEHEMRQAEDVLYERVK